MHGEPETNIETRLAGWDRHLVNGGPGDRRDRHVARMMAR